MDVTLSNTGAVTTFGQGFRAENIPNIRVGSFGTGAILDLSSFDSRSATSLINSGSTGALTFTNVANLAPITITGVTAATQVQYADTLVPTGNTTVAATVNVAGASNSGQAVAVILRGQTAATDGAAAVTVNGTGAQSDITLDSGNATLRTLTANAGVNPLNITTTAASTGVRSLTFSGTGTASVDISASTQNVTVTGGSGADTVIFADAQLNANDSIALGGGTNTLGISVAAAANGAAIASAAGINAATGVSQLTLVGTGTTVGNAGTTFFNGVNFSAVNPNTVVLQGFTAANGTQDYATTAGAAGGAAFTATNVTTAKTLVVSADVSATAANAAAALSASAINASASLPLQTLNLQLTPGSRDATAIQVAGGAGGAGSVGTGVAGNVASAAINNLANIATINLASNGTTGTNSIIGGAGGVGGNSNGANNNGGNGGAAGQAFANVAGQTFNISGSRALTIAGGAAGAAGAVAGGGGNAGAGGLRALGFTNQVNIQASAATGNLSIQGSGALISNAGVALTAGNVLLVGDVIVTGSGSDTIVGGGGGDVITTGSGSDQIAYITGNAGEIASGDATPTAAELGALADAGLLDRITDFAAASDRVLVNTGNAFFSANQVTFTGATTTNVGSFAGITGNAITNLDGLLAAFNGAVTGGAVASTAGTLQSYVFTTGSITGGLANASNQTFLVINNGAAAIQNDDFIINITGLTGTFGSSNIAYGVV